MNNAYLLAFSIGPVQEFISTARRTQDWWMGSWLLSHLCRLAINKLSSEAAELILPQNLSNEVHASSADTPNHFFARLNTETPAATASAIETCVRTEWFHIGQRVKKLFFQGIEADLWDRQIATFLECYWVVVPEDSGTGARNKAQGALDARKRMRNFLPATELHQKCSLCGVRQELSGKTSISDARGWWRSRVDSHQGRLRVREDGSERLCAICTIKRAALTAGVLPLDRSDGHFPSTSSIAAAPFKRQLMMRKAVQSELQSYLQALETLGFPTQVTEDCLPALSSIQVEQALTELKSALLRFDGDLFYPEMLTLKRIAKDYPHMPGAILAKGAAELEWTEEELFEADPTYVNQQIDAAAVSLRRLLAAVRHHAPHKHIEMPSKYFAALMMDGDRMGLLYSHLNEELAQDLSRRMSRFAREQAQDIVERHVGRLVYAGGDDVLALLPLEEVLFCARELRTAFHTLLEGLSIPAGAPPPTISAGIAVAHHTAPLDSVLLAMQRAEKSAKNDYGRDALCVHILKRSGEEVRVGTHWNYDQLDIISLIARLVELMRQEALTLQFVQGVFAEARGLQGNRVPKEARMAALRRLARRHSVDGWQEETASIAEHLAAWAEGEHLDDGRPLGIQSVADWIGVARFIVRGRRDDK